MKSSYTAILMAFLILDASSTEASVLNASPTTIAAVFAKAKSGDTIKLIGSFGRVTLSGRTFGVALKIDATRATFSDTLLIKDVSGLYITGGKYGSSTGTTSYNKAIAVYNGTNVTINKAYVIGSQAGSGIGVTSTTNVTVSNSTFDGLKSGVGFTSVTGGMITNNKSIRSSSDGFDIADSHKVTVTGNSCSGTIPGAGAHPDCVQLWSFAGNPPQSDITVTGNTATGATQGFTSFNEADGGGIRINISNNKINTSYPQGIACYGCIDSIFTKNVLTTLAGAKSKTNINIIHGSNNVVAQNSIGNKPGTNSVSSSSVLASTSNFTTYSTTQQSADPFGQSAVKGQIAESQPLDGTVVAGIPEPSAWLLMIAGFGFVGGAMRRRSRPIVRA